MTAAPSISVKRYADWYKMAGEFFKAVNAGATPEQIDAGFKALSLGWIGLGETPTPQQAYESGIIFDMASRVMIKAGL